MNVPSDNKLKKGPVVYAKKSSGPVPNHHSTSLYPTSDLNSHYEQRTFSNFELGSRHGDLSGWQDRSTLESSSKKKRDKDKEKERDRENREREKERDRSRAESELLPHLPDVPGAEGKQNLCMGNTKHDSFELDIDG